VRKVLQSLATLGESLQSRGCNVPGKPATVQPSRSRTEGTHILRTRISFAGLLTCWALAYGSAGAQAPAPAPAPAAKPARAASAPDASTTPAPQAALSKGEIKAMREFKMLDFNGDNKLSRTEVKLFPRLAAAFDDADTDRDGYVSYAEVQVFAVKYRAERDRKRAEQAAAAAAAQPPASAASDTQR
jgi:hypothetical protein